MTAGFSIEALEDWLSPVSDSPPCGENLEYEPVFTQIEKAASRIASQEFGEHSTQAQEPKWSEVLALAQPFFARSKDLRIAALVARALVHTQGIAGLPPAIGLIHALLERFWEAVHPRLEGDGDPTMRINALATLYNTETFLGDLRGARLVDSREHGRLSVREVEMALGRLPVPPDVEVPSLDEIRAQLAASFSAGNGCRDAIAQSIDSIAAIRALLVDRVDAQHAPDFKALVDILVPIRKVCDEALPQATPQTDNPAGPAAEDLGAARSLATSSWMGSEPRSRDDAARLLEKVCGYLERYEPSSPAPLLIRRAQRLLSKSFVEIVQDLMPDSLSSLERVAGKLEAD